MTSLGTQGLKTSRIGLGCMGMSEFYGTRDDSESLKTLGRAHDLGITFWDTADMYGPYLNEELLSLALKGIRSEITLATKFGIVRDPSDPTVRGYNGTPKYVQSSCEASLKRLKVETIDLYYMHRMDPNTPIEETVGAMSRLVEQGKIRYVGLSEVNSDILRRANAVHPISALQNEYSLWSREPEDDILGTCKELGIGFVAYSPLGRGFLTGQIKKYEDFDADDYRRMSPRFQGENFTKNLELVRKIEALAKLKECKPSQLALAWVIAQGDGIVPIPGTKRIPYLEENFGALKVTLTKEDLIEIDSIAPKGIAKGARYPEWKKNTVS
ncbi:aldo/keto reductase [Leptospira tipperaryensis]|uniref:Aldo/keto reductase n=1 Tax=Leptospira tipperaryensis TaxID=2564040 RepID=A0A1D7V0Z0_9LEPT|nr:aldo/keto reductase [Leptospira tipperaryensis]AOP35485.1 aldo/keto reductase [Leptospira tipperaryensis]